MLIYMSLCGVFHLFLNEILLQRVIIVSFLVLANIFISLNAFFVLISLT